MLRDLTPAVYERLEAVGARLEAGLTAAIAATGGGARVQRVGAMLGVYFRDAPVANLADARTCDVARFGPPIVPRKAKQRFPLRDAWPKRAPTGSPSTQHFLGSKG